MVKLKALGAPSRYRVEVYDRIRASLSQKPITKYGNSYDKRKFAFYQSYDGQGGNEAVVDKRANVLRHPMFWLGLPLLGLLGLYSFYNVFSYLNPKSEKPAKASEKPAAAAQKPAAAPTPPSPPKSATWRLVGRYSKGGYPVFVIQDTNGTYRHWSPVPAVLGEFSKPIMIDGDTISTWSGSAPATKGMLP